MEKLTFGWEEWISLPELGLPAIRAKVDTGARTSALHADDIEVFGPSRTPKVRFTVHPIAGRSDVTITSRCTLSEPVPIKSFGEAGVKTVKVIEELRRSMLFGFNTMIASKSVISEMRPK